MNFSDKFRNQKSKSVIINSAEKYLDHLDQVFHRKALYFRSESAQGDLPSVTTIVYKDFPKKGFTTGLTYGLSLKFYPGWKFSRPELCICVESDNIDWAQATGYIANSLRGSCPFFYGQTIDFEGYVSQDSEIDAFLLFAPSIFDKKEDYTNIEVGEDYKISIVQLYPIYSSELPVLKQIGLKSFWNHPDFDLFSIHRKRIHI